MGDDLVPSHDRISRDALERIIHRAAELQASQREIGDGLTERDVLDLGKEVGIPTRHLQQALLEERARTAARDQGFLAKLSGPKRVSAERTVPGTRTEVDNALSYWMTDVELLAVKRRYPYGTSWEPRKDWLATVKRGIGLGGRKYVLTRAKDVLGRVEALEEAWCHVMLVADISSSRNGRVAGGAVFFGAGGTMTAIAGVLGVATVVAVIPAVAGVAGGIAIAQSHRRQAEHTHVALEQVLDRLERREIRVPTGSSKPHGGDFVKRLTAEIKDIGKQLGR